MYLACNAHVPYCHLVACPSLKYFSTLSLKRDDFRKTVIDYEICVLIFYSALSKIFFIPRISVLDMVKNVHGLLVKYHLFLSDLNELHGHEVTLRKRIFATDLLHFDTKM